MSIIKVIKKKHNYTTIDNTCIQDIRLSWKAKGMLVYLISLPADWEINLSDLKNRSKDGRDGTSSAIQELMINGYILRHDSKNKLGQFQYDYTVFEQPQQIDRNGKTVTEKPKRSSRNGKPTTTKDNLQLLKQLETIQEEIKTESKSEKEFPQPLPPDSEIQNLIEVKHPDEVNDDLTNGIKSEKEQENEGAAVIVKFEQNYEPLPEKAKETITDTRKKTTFKNSIQLVDYLRSEVFNKESNVEYCEGLKNAYNVAKIKFSGEVYEKTILQFSLHQFSNLSEKQIVQFSIDELYSKICTWVLREGNYQASKQASGNLTFQKQPEKIIQNTGTDLNAFLKTLNAYR